MDIKLSGVCLVSDNVSALVAFYTAVLGVAAAGDDTHSEISLAGASLALFSSAGMESMAPGSMHGAGAGNVTLMFEVDDVDAAYERLQALGVCFVKLPETHPWGSRSFWFRDPDGNMVDFFAHVTV